MTDSELTAAIKAAVFEYSHFDIMADGTKRHSFDDKGVDFIKRLFRAPVLSSSNG